jgi:hypothetical protein
VEADVTRHYLVEVPGDHPLDAEDLGELEAFAQDRLHVEATVTEVQHLDPDDLITKVQDGWTGPAYERRR